MAKKNQFTNIKKKVLGVAKQHKKLLKSAKKNIKSKRTITIIALIAVLVVLAVAFNLNRFMLKEVVAAVNGEEITADELEEKYDFFFFLTGYPESYRQIIDKEAYLNQMINEELLLQEAAKNRISVLDKEVEEDLDELIDRSPVTKAEFEINLNEAGFNMRDLFDYYRNQMIITELLEEEFSDIEISEEEIKSYYNANKDSFVGEKGEIRLKHILVETQEEAEEILAELKKGADFASLAKERSIGPSGVNGGDLGFVSLGQMVQEFEEAAFKLNVNQLSGAVETQFGYHIIKREPNVIYFSEAKEGIVEILKAEKQQELLGVYLDGLKEGADIVISFGGETKATGESCYSEYDLSSDTVIFYHADWCPHCKTMKPIVEQLQEEGYSFHSAETSNGDGVDVVDACFRDVIQGGVPQFICAGNKEFKMGAMNKAALEAFAESCQ
ncbi:peptidylprolyl isomerase [Candidatus Woesearchaeota archaeon]|nr:peptidylprolyl isomerase [Candidatus Woesearchaeota archaeon]